MRRLTAVWTAALLACAGIAAAEGSDAAAPPGARKHGKVRFAARPKAEAAGDGAKISFVVSAPTDVEVAILDAEGKVVRHLAAGVLGGKQPPPAPLRPGLSQKLSWDGRGDWKQPAGKGPFRVRVRAGMDVRFGRTIGESPYNFGETVCRGLAVDPSNGDLYVMSRKTRDSSLYFLRVYDRRGKYLREIMPYRADLDDASREVFGRLPVPWSDAPAPMNYFSLWPYFYPVNPKGESRHGLAYKLMTVHPTDGSVLLLAESFASMYRIRKSDGGAVSNGFAERLWPRKTRLAGSAAVGPVMGACAPDGKTIYFAGYAAAVRKGRKTPPGWPEGRVFKMRPGEGRPSIKTFADVPIPKGALPPMGSWNILGHTQALHGLTVDKAGRVFVCDAANGKVWVYSPEGKVVGSAAVAHAYMVAVDAKAGALYVLTRRSTRGTARNPVVKSLVKLDGWGEGAKVVDTLTFPERTGACDVFLAGDFTGPAPRLWVSGCPRVESLIRVEEAGGKLKVVEDLADRGRLAPGFAIRMDVDAETDLVYVHNGWAKILRYDGLTGKYAGQLDKAGRPKPLVGSEFCIRRDGMIYLSGHTSAGGGYSGPWRRLNRDLTPAPLPDGKKQFSDRYGKMGGGYFGNQGACVTPDGTLYYNGMITFRVNAVFEVKPDGSAGRCPRLRDGFATGKISPHCVKAGFDGALVGWLQDQSGGLEVDQQGNLYVGVRILPRGYRLPDGLAKAAGGARPLAHSVGSVIKFGAAGGGMVPDNLKPAKAYKVSKHWPVEFKTPDKLAAGIKMGSGQRLDWYNPPWTIHMEGGLKAYPMLAPFSSTCACQTPRFDVDDYGRLYLPNALGCTVQVVDNAGNLITRFGRYGNFGDQAAARPGQTAVPLAYPVAAKASFKHVYVADSANRQVVRVDPVYAAEEICGIEPGR